MSLARAFTTRRNKLDLDTMFTMHIGRHGSQRNNAKPTSRRPDISGPVELISTSNNTLYDKAEVIAGTMRIPLRGEGKNSREDLSSTDDSDDNSAALSSSTSSAGTDDRATITDSSSIDGSSPISPPVEPNHLSCYFQPAVDTTTASTPSRSAHAASPSLSSTTSSSPALDAPIIPKRMPSHSKRAHEHIYKKRSIQRSLSLTKNHLRQPSSSEQLDSQQQQQQSSRWSPQNHPTPTFSSSSTSTPAATTPALTTPANDMTRENPFEHELQQVDELAEDFHYHSPSSSTSTAATSSHAAIEALVARSAEEDAEVAELRGKGLGIYSGEDYAVLVQEAVRVWMEGGDEVVLIGGGNNGREEMQWL